MCYPVYCVCERTRVPYYYIETEVSFMRDQTLIIRVSLSRDPHLCVWMFLGALRLRALRLFAHLTAVPLLDIEPCTNVGIVYIFQLA